MSWDYERNGHTQTKISPEKKNGKVVGFFRLETGTNTNCVGFNRFFKERPRPTENTKSWPELIILSPLAMHASSSQSGFPIHFNLLS